MVMVMNKRTPKLPPVKEPSSRVPGAYNLKWAVNWRAVINLILLFFTLEIAVLSVEGARWITPQPSLTLTLVLSVLAAAWLSRKRLPGVIIRDFPIHALTPAGCKQEHHNP